MFAILNVTGGRGQCRSYTSGALRSVSSVVVVVGGVEIDEKHLSVFHSISNRACRKLLRNSISSETRCAFNSFFLSPARDVRIHVTWFDRFYVDWVTAHCIKINDYSCFHNLLPNSKTKLKWKHLWEQGAPGVSGPYTAGVFCILGGSALTEASCSFKVRCLSQVDFECSFQKTKIAE